MNELAEITKALWWAIGFLLAWNLVFMIAFVRVYGKIRGSIESIKYTLRYEGIFVKSAREIWEIKKRGKVIRDRMEKVAHD
jgi:hypothetical protein